MTGRESEAEFQLERFVEAQARVFDTALAELLRGGKESHWMWFVFPQLARLGRSETAIFYGIRSGSEARAYLAHPLLGPRLLECAHAVLMHRERRPEEIFGSIDAMKFRSSMTLFEAVDERSEPFSAALETFYGGERDSATLQLLG
jgi:uncharacterized protein (DUF1810 family)